MSTGWWTRININVEYLINRSCEYWLMNQDKHRLQIASMSFRSGCLVGMTLMSICTWLTWKISNQGWLRCIVHEGDIILTKGDYILTNWIVISVIVSLLLRKLSDIEAFIYWWMIMLYIMFSCWASAHSCFVVQIKVKENSPILERLGPEDGVYIWMAWWLLQSCTREELGIYLVLCRVERLNYIL